MNLAIVDDSIKEMEKLSAILKDYAGKKGLTIKIEYYESAEDLLKKYAASKFYCIFLDIFMGGITGIEAARRIRKLDNNVNIVFLTGSAEHMAEAFDVHAFHYLLKPDNNKALEKSVFHLMDDLTKKFFPSLSLHFAYEKKEYHMPVSQILYVKSSNHNLEIANMNGNLYLPRMTFSAAYDLLKNDSRFLQINRGIVVNMDRIKSLMTQDSKTCVVEGDICLPVNVRDCKRIAEIRQNYIFMKMHSEMDEEENYNE